MLVDVALPVSLYRTFTYRLNRQIDPSSLIGKRVLVPFRNHRYYGFITGITTTFPEGTELRDILHIDQFNTFTESEIKIIKEISEFYVSPIGLTAYYFAPNYLKGKGIQDPLYEKVFRINPEKKPASRLSPAKQRLIETLENLGEASFTQLKMLGFQRTTILSLLKDGFIVEVKPNLHLAGLRQNIQLMEASKKLTNSVYSMSFAADIDRVYMLAKNSKKLLSEGCSSLIILPSVMAAVKYHQLLSSYIPDIKLYHDALSPKKQLETWLSVMKQPSVVVGTMSSLLIPARNLKLVWVELEHSNSYRSPMTPRFETKRVAYVVGRVKSASVVYADRLPSLETYMMLRTKKAVQLKTQKPAVNNIEIRPFRGFTAALRSIRKVVDTGGQTLIIANKSYYAAYIHCERCGFEWLCDRCNIPFRVILKSGKKVLRCPECGREAPYSKRCPDCENTLTEEGFGSHKILDYLHDYDVSLYEEEKNTKIRILSSLEGKLILDRYNTVINIYPDFLQYLDRYDANEQFFRTVLSPLFVTAERYIIFSNISPDTTVYRIIKQEESFNAIYDQELNFREKFRYPPVEKYTRLEIVADRETTISRLREVLGSCSDLKFEYRKGMFYRAVLKNIDRETLKQIYEKFSAKGKLSIEVNTKNI